MKKYMILSAAILSLSACKTTVQGKSPDVKVEGKGYGVHIEDEDHHHHGKFCPPGQAKKGNC